MKLKTVVFYQSVKNWDNNESNTFKADQSQLIELDDHLVKVTKEGRKEIIIVPTANMRYGVAVYAEAYKITEPQPSSLSEISSSSPEELTKESLTKSKKRIEKVADAKQ